MYVLFSHMAWPNDNPISKHIMEHLELLARDPFNVCLPGPPIISDLKTPPIHKSLTKEIRMVVSSHYGHQVESAIKLLASHGLLLTPLLTTSAHHQIETCDGKVEMQVAQLGRIEGGKPQCVIGQ